MEIFQLSSLVTYSSNFPLNVNTRNDVCSLCSTFKTSTALLLMSFNPSASLSRRATSIKASCLFREIQLKLWIIKEHDIFCTKANKDGKGWRRVWCLRVKYFVSDRWCTAIKTEISVKFRRKQRYTSSNDCRTRHIKFHINAFSKSAPTLRKLKMRSEQKQGTKTWFRSSILFSRSYFS